MLDRQPRGERAFLANLRGIGPAMGLDDSLELERIFLIDIPHLRAMDMIVRCRTLVRAMMAGIAGDDHDRTRLALPFVPRRAV